MYLTIAAGASSSYLAHTEMAKVTQYIDTVNLMAYDYYEPGEPTGHHAPLFTNPADPKKISADRSVHEFEQAGVPAKKIVLGVPFYGYGFGKAFRRGTYSFSAIVAAHPGAYQHQQRYRKKTGQRATIHF